MTIPKRLVEHIVQRRPLPRWAARPALAAFAVLAALAAFAVLAALAAFVTLLSLRPAPVAGASGVLHPPFDLSYPLAITDTTTTLTSAPNPSECGETVTFTATVTEVPPGPGTPTGTVTFKDGGVTIGTATLVAGVASFATSSLAVGEHIITAEYGGDGNFNGSTSAPLVQTVTKGGTTTTLTSSTNPSVFGQAITLTATVASACATPTGVVFFNLEDGTSLGTAALDATGIATFTTSALATGVHEITAVYAGDENNKASESASLTQTVNPADTTTTVTSSVSPSVFGQPVTFEATVVVVAPGAGTPTGKVTFKDGGTPIGTGVLDGSGKATFTTSALTVGTHTIEAAYDGDGNFNTSSDTVTQTVGKADTTTAVTGPTSSDFGESVTFIATVTADAPGAGSPTGTVTFKVDGTAVSTESLVLGEARFTPTNPLPAGARSITAEYNGDGNFKTSSTTFTHTVDKADTKTTISSPTPTTVLGQDVTFNVSVEAISPGVGLVTGTVTIKDGTTPITTTTLSSGGVNFTTSDLTVGSHTITATYNDGSSPNFNGSTSGSITQTVTKADSATTLESSVNPSVFGQTVTFTATVAATGLGLAAPVSPTGTVTFTLGTASTVTKTLNGSGIATVVTSTLPVGVHEIKADYGGDPNFNGSTASLTQTVNKADTTTTLTSSAPTNTSVIGESVTFTATVTVDAPGGGTPTGTVSFLDGGAVLTTTALSSSVATFTTDTFTAGSHPISARYNGAPSFKNSTSDILFHTVSAAGATATLVSSPNPSVFGQTVFFTVTVTAATGTPTGNVTFKDGATILGGATLDASGKAFLQTSILAAGTHPITAVYGGDATFAGTTSNQVDQVVNKATTTTAITSDTPDPSVVGQPVPVSYSVTAVAPGSGTPTGNVTVSDGTDSCTGTVAAGSCTLTPTTSGSKTLTATYAGDGNFNGSSDTEPHTVAKAETTTTVTSFPNPSLPGQDVKLTANVTAQAPGAGTPTGTVQFKINGSPIGSPVPLSSSASLTTTFTVTGTFTIAADYSGDSNFEASSGSATHEVGDTPSDLSVQKTDSPDPVNAGDDLTYTIDVTNDGPGQTAVLTDTLPIQVTFKSVAAPSGWACTTPAVGSTGTVECSKAMAGNTTETITIVVNVPVTTPAGTVLANTAQVSGSRPDFDLTNNTHIQETTVIRSPQLGDCNGDAAVDLGDIWSIVRDIFDADFEGNLGCDANRDSRVDAGDIPCTALIIFDGPGACMANNLNAAAGLSTASGSATAAEGPTLVMPEEVPALPGVRVPVPVTFTANGHNISSLVFSVDYDEAWLALDPADRDGDGIPDAVTFTLPSEFDASVTFDSSDIDGELDIVIADIFPPLTGLWDGTIALIMLDVENPPDTTEEPVQFSHDPPASFGNTVGQSVPGTATPTRRRYQLYLPLVNR